MTCGCGHAQARHCGHCGRCNGTLEELELEPWESDLPPGTVCECTEFGEETL